MYSFKSIEINRTGNLGRRCFKIMTPLELLITDDDDGGDDDDDDRDDGIK